jgi:Ca2+-binding RTX toxin-like protein
VIGSTVTVQNSLIADSALGPNCHLESSAIVSSGFNLVDDDSCAGVGAPTDLIGVDPALGALAPNGGPTATMALPATSPAVDNGSSAGLTGGDQRGLDRPSDFPLIPNVAGGDGSDIGAYELQAVPDTCMGRVVTILGTDGDDVVPGTSGDDVISVGIGRDTVQPSAGNDLVCGGDGKNRLSGGSGKDILLGGVDVDSLNGGGGKDKLKGGRGKDRLRGGGGKDRCVGQQGKDRANGCEKEKSIP